MSSDLSGPMDLTADLSLSIETGLRFQKLSLKAWEMKYKTEEEIN